MPDPEQGAASVLNQYENEGKKISKFGLSRIVKELRKFRSYKLALGVKKNTRYSINVLIFACLSVLFF